MKKTATSIILLTAALLLAGGLLPTAGRARAADSAEAATSPREGGEDAPTQWALVFENDTPQPLVLPSPLNRLTYYWYMVYRVKNPTKKPVPTNIEVTLKLTIQKEHTTCRDVHDIVAERHIEKRIVERPLLNWNEMSRKTLDPGKSREAVAIFRVGPRAAEFDKMTITLRGLAARTALGRQGNVQKFRVRVLSIFYDYVDSRWTDTKELKYDDEKWEIKVVELTDRTDSNKRAVEESAERLKKLYERLEKLRKGAPKTKPKPAPKASAAPDRNGITTSAQGTGRPDPKLVKALGAKADRHRSTRAAFTEIVGPEGRRHKATGTLYLRNDSRFAIERSLNVGAARALKELRVFDGKALWTHTATRELGDSVRRWNVAATKKQWYSVAGRPEVDFPTLVNPVRAWRLFSSDLVRLGVERLEAEVAYVFEVRPGEKLRPVLTGPLTGELLAQAAGRRVRFWVGAKSGFQLRMRVYDRMGEVVASLECADVELDAHLPEARFAFAPPPGVKVIDMNAVMAANDK
jgi:outer membrane lipoprotein-sorting protein